MATAPTSIGSSKVYALSLVEKMLRVSAAAAILLLFCVDLPAMEWREITPLKSTRADVERLLGKETNGSYEFSDERVNIRYAQSPCEERYLPLRKDYCECLVPKDTVLSIEVIPRVYKKFSELQFNATPYRRERARSGFPEFVYSKSEEGITYTVDESRDKIVSVYYSASTKDCQEVSHTKGLDLNSWRGLVPLHSMRTQADRLLGRPTSTISSTAGYKTQEERVLIRYAKNNCGSGGTWNVPVDTILELRITPMTTILLEELDLDLDKYNRAESTHPENVFYYLNSQDGIMIQTRLREERETVTAITYGHSMKDEQLRCKKLDEKRPVQQ